MKDLIGIVLVLLFASTDAKHAPNKCNLATSPMAFLDMDDCISDKTYSISYCSGTCGVSVTRPVVSHTTGVILTNCVCCGGTPGNPLNIPMTCSGGIKINATITPMETCDCKPCV